MKIGYLHNTPPAQHISNEEKFIALGKNTGNLVFRDALWRLFDPFNIPYDRQEFIEQFEKVIITDLIWIKEGAEYNYLERILDKYPVSLIPMSIGLQNKSFYDLSFHLSQQLVRLLKKMQERAVLGCRGEYTAEVLSKNGIKNIEMIGCPSMYYWNNRRLKIRSRAKPVHCSANFRSFSRALTENEKNFLNCDRWRKFTMIYLQMIESEEDKVKFEEIYLKYKALMFYTANKILHNEQDAEDYARECSGAFAEGAEVLDLAGQAYTPPEDVDFVVEEVDDED